MTTAFLRDWIGNWLCVSGLLLSCLAMPAYATVYSDAQEGLADWQVVDDQPAGAQIVTRSDAILNSQVIQTTGNERNNAYRLGGTESANGWNNTSEFHANWRLQTTESFIIYIRVDTTDGWRYLTYTSSNSDGLANSTGRNIHHGLGSRSKNGNWHVFSRDLAADLAAAQPANSLLAVNGMLVRGSVRLDDITLATESVAQTVLPVVSSVVNADAEDGNTSLWRIFDVTPAGASISIVTDDTQRSQVYELSGTGRSNGFQMGGLDSVDGWNNQTQSVIAWDMRASSGYQVYVRVETTGGMRYLIYSNSNSDSLLNANGRDISFGLGSGSRDGKWHSYRRNLVADIALAEPGNALVAVHGFLVRGSLLLDNIRLFDAAEDDVEDTVPTANPEPEADKPPVAAFSVNSPVSGSTVTFSNESSDDKGVTSVLWNFGDATETDQSTQTSPVFSYSSTGDYTVTLTVLDSAGQMDTATQVISITALDSPVEDPPGEDPPVEVPSVEDPPGGGWGNGVTSEAAARLLAQASFGASSESIARVQQLGLEGWIDEQFTLQGAPHLDFVRAHSNGSRQEPRHEVWWRDVVEGEDQLRQRVAFALSQILVVSDQGYTLSNAQYGVTHYYDQLREQAFGSYRDLLETVTLSPVMGVYLSMLQNARGDMSGNTRADENFAREVLQLFSIGLYELNIDGSVKTAGGQPIHSFTQAQIEHYARVFTGWNFGGATDWTLASINSRANKLVPMQAWPGYHDDATKWLLGGAVAAAGSSAEADLQLALDSIANHANVGPFISRQLIQRLVSSNPTPAYIARVSRVFNDNGAGVRGDLQAVVKAILLDEEARNGHLDLPEFGKLREPLLRLSHLWRAFDITPGTDSVNGIYNTSSPHVKDLDLVAGQAVLKSPSVFNFFRPDYSPLGPINSRGKVAPEAEIYTDDTILSMTNRIDKQIQYGHDISDANARRSSYLRLDAERALAAISTEALLDHLDVLLLSGGMSDGLRDVLVTYLESLPAANTEAGQSRRVRDALSLIMASPDYLVQM